MKLIDLLATSYLLLFLPTEGSPASTSTLYSSRHIVQLPSIPLKAAQTIYNACRLSCCVIFAFVFAAGSLTVIFNDIVLVVLCLIRQTLFLSEM